MKQCKCGSMAFNLAHEGIDQGDLCDRHYWQGRAERAAVLIEMCETSLKSLENANDERARLTTSEAYCAALKADGMREALDDLDVARRNARKTLAAIASRRGQS